MFFFRHLNISKIPIILRHNKKHPTAPLIPNQQTHPTPFAQQTLSTIEREIQRTGTRIIEEFATRRIRLHFTQQIIDIFTDERLQCGRLSHTHQFNFNRLPTVRDKRDQVFRVFVCAGAKEDFIMDGHAGGDFWYFRNCLYRENLVFR